MNRNIIVDKIVAKRVEVRAKKNIGNKEHIVG